MRSEPTSKLPPLVQQRMTHDMRPDRARSEHLEVTAARRHPALAVATLVATAALWCGLFGGSARAQGTGAHAAPNLQSAAADSTDTAFTMSDVA